MLLNDDKSIIWKIKSDILNDITIFTQEVLYFVLIKNLQVIKSNLQIIFATKVVISS